MKKRILTNWTITRMLYLIIGITLIIQSVIGMQWLGILFGGYFAAMGLFAFGCAGENCSVSTPIQKTNVKVQDIDFEEVK